MEFMTVDGKLLYIVPSQIKAIREVLIQRPGGFGNTIEEWGSEIVTNSDLCWAVRNRYSTVVTAFRKATKLAITRG